jgi:hypothetical protein
MLSLGSTGRGRTRQAGSFCADAGKGDRRGLRLLLFTEGLGRVSFGGPTGRAEHRGNRSGPQ